MHYLSGLAIPEWVVSTAMTLLVWAPAVLVVFYLFRVSQWGYKLVMDQYVVGEPNEWVVILREGEQAAAGIGLSCFKQPWDSVAKFPSKLVKVEVTT